MCNGISFMYVIRYLGILHKNRIKQRTVSCCTVIEYRVSQNDLHYCGIIAYVPHELVTTVVHFAFVFFVMGNIVENYLQIKYYSLFYHKQ